ncbi:SDR family oxidoreductase [Roseomonas marmotae]|uniref:SDR family oxidoreductase n=1 Tax=Roseomonas marmotae TaxID=2768161 RepID=A0ABS3K8M4_9PROT|nr:SDR family oxidoreductase [Roseomonas marmotae]MBO1073809.1 SDR family oxidoreductase [Roseomonas marmotae]QTI78561.1 SDR family oxidoreductase [Roseomonas marmotae]
MTGITGKVIAITGASSGIGAATAMLLAERGAKLVLGARRAGPLEALEASIRQAGGVAISLPTDVRRRDDLAALVAAARQQFGRPDVMISNAGAGPISPVDDLRVEDWEEMIAVNFRGVLHGVAAALPLFRAQQSGHFVHVLSTAGLKIVPMQSVYAATKNAARTFSEGLRQEAGETLRVTMISPGMVRTRFTDSMTDPRIRARMDEAMEQMGLPPEAVARSIAFAIEQPDDVDVSEIVIRPTAQA